MLDITWSAKLPPSHEFIHSINAYLRFHQCSSPGATGISGLHSRRTRGDRHSSRVEAKKPALLSSRTALMYSFSYLEPVCCSMASSNCCCLTCIQISQEAGQVVWYSHLLKNFPQFVVIHKVKGFGIVNKAEIDVFLELSCFFDDPADVGNLISGSSAFLKSSLNIWKFTVHILLKPGLENFEHYFTSM